MYIVSVSQELNQSIFICTEPIQNKSHLTALSRLSWSKTYSLINLFIETNHSTSEQVVGDGGKKKAAESSNTTRLSGVNLPPLSERERERERGRRSVSTQQCSFILSRHLTIILYRATTVHWSSRKEPAQFSYLGQTPKQRKGSSALGTFTPLQ